MTAISEAKAGAVMDARAEAVVETVDDVRRIETEMGVNRPALERIKERLIALATRTELFPEASFPVAGGLGEVYRLAEDADHRFALYASAGVPGKAAPPHDHTTWAVIAGVYGEEHNVFYERTEDRSATGRGSLRKTGELTIVKGNACSLSADDFHTIEIRSNRPALHLHMYGMSLEHLPERITFAGATGRYFVYPPATGIAAPVVSPQEVRDMRRDGGEMAFLDVREEGVFSEEGHPFFACAAPLSRLELMIGDLVPRPLTRIVLYDSEDGLADRAAAKLAYRGYRNIAVMAGGARGWQAAGFELFTRLTLFLQSPIQ
jgi:predicted metal-dependent enzyme (double-stranded beta helix superfamily)/rhodanese-related sulfurtransferase